MYKNGLPHNFIQKAKEKLSGWQSKLKGLTKSHLTERKQIAAVHSRLSHINENEKEELKSMVMSLSQRHKDLLSLFTAQKDVKAKIGEVEKQYSRTKGKTSSYIG